MSIHPNNYNLKQVLSESGDLYIPWFQRDYTWDDEKIDDLFLDLFDEYSWEDIAGSHRNGEPLRDYFMGAVMLCGPGETRRMVLDGQQRLTTLTMMVAHLLRLMTKHKSLHGLHREGLAVLRNPKKNQSNRLMLKEGLPESPKECDDTVYRQIVDSAASGEALDLERNPDDETNQALADRQIYQTYLYLARKLEDALRDAANSNYDEELALQRLFEVLTSRLHFVSVRTDDEDYAIKFFETLNARGEKLRSDDLVKNAIFLQAGDDKKIRDVVIESWDKLTTLLPDSKDRIDFLRFLWNSQHVFIGKTRVYQHYKRHFLTLKSSADIKAFCVNLVFQGSFYRDICKANRNYEFCRGLSLLGAKICRPVLLAVNHKYREHDPVERRQKVQDMVRILEAVMMRCSICHEVTTALERGFAKIARDIHTTSDTWPVILKDIREELAKPEYSVPSDRDFADKISDAVLSDKDLFKQKWRAFFATLDRHIASPADIYIPPLVEIKLDFISAGRAKYQKSVGNVRTTLKAESEFNAKTINPSISTMAPGNWNQSKIANQEKRVVDAALECWKL